MTSWSESFSTDAGYRTAYDERVRRDNERRHNERIANAYSDANDRLYYEHIANTPWYAGPKITKATGAFITAAALGVALFLHHKANDFINDQPVNQSPDAPIVHVVD